ncbi:hypothetical protein M2459_002889 [Parabacteroides sp. PF5-5]|uniref:hypothetical protein n=1 Tax=unclassified Parabacteroides TaxID=2649774 RepID=UPI002475B73B|nr:MULTISPECIES: hypothetical protein [unclassified Parabacteroides]MDH6306175.1 hypothetical protein [Parabacteroides sp. PH5-39]MDH6317134.1 hypothetical protein [Parabacteroides sp. PF5-13]MDH6320887.1 hypothetical protein [Parabacteroides sp. PH5-13]MDH6324618.1 hypothetical protein [Parabacteroides sp. PH5-8]MDH6328331.1 hypothetical protein [Parabacteroides sp. PH5-41]
MKTNFWFLLIAVLIISSQSFSAIGQEYKPFSKLDASLRFSTMGLGLEAITPLSPNFRARAGVDYLGFNTSHYNISLEDNGGYLNKAFGYTPDYRAKFGLSMFHGHLLVDYHPMPTGIFYITAGVYAGSNKIDLDGFLSNPENDNMAVLLPGMEWPELDLDGHKIDVTNGYVEDLELKLGGAIKPYLGFGLGRTFGKSKFGYKVELGVLYQGDYSVKQSGVKIDEDSTGLNDFEDIDKYTKWLKWWPMVNFQLTYNIF